MKLKKILMLTLFSLALTANAAMITKFKNGKGEYKVYYKGNLKCKDFKLNNPERFVVDLIGVSKCSVCDGKLYTSKFQNIEIGRCWHKYGSDKIGRIYNKDVLRISFIGSNVDKFVCLKDKKDKIITVKYSAGKTENKAQSAKLNEIERISLRKFNTYEMIVVLLKKRPDFQFKKINNAIYLTINKVKASKSALLGQDLQKESENIKSILAVQTSQDSIRYMINLKKGSKVSRYYADSRHIYVIFPARINGRQLVRSNAKNKGVSAKNDLVNKKNENVLGVDRLISFNVRDAQLKDIFRVFAQISGLNFIIGDDVKGTLTMKLKDVPLDQAMNLILQQEGLVAERKGNVVIIMTAAKYEKEKKKEFEALMQKRLTETLNSSHFKVFHLNYITSDYALTIINDILYSKKRLGGLGEESMPVKTPTENGSNEYDNETKRYVSGFIVSDTKNNSLICYDTDENLNKIKKILNMIDLKRKTIEIDARIVEISKTFERQLGIQWGGSFENYYNAPYTNKTFIGVGTGGFPDTGSNVGSVTSSTVSGGTTSGTIQNAVPSNPFNQNLPKPGQDFIVNLPTTLQQAPVAASVGLLLGRVNYNIDLQLTAGEIEGYTKIISSPKVLTLANEKAVIESGQEIPYQESAGASGATSVDFKKATLSLEVTPYITKDNQILMKIKVSKSSADYNHILSGVPPINTNTVETSAIVPNGDTIVLGGLVQKTNLRTESGVPGLMRIPLLGWLFKTKRYYNPESELFIFVTPKIINIK